jgi:radical SAM superfamily enzyme YgiQ (UPF0313 family)
MASYRSGDAMPPLVFAILKSLTPPEYDIRFYDNRVEDIDFDEPTNLVAISVGTFTARQSYRIADIYRRKNIPVVMGGYHASLMAEEAKEHADSVVVGNAESIWTQLLDDFSQGILKPFYIDQDKATVLQTSYDYSIFSGKKYFPINLVEWGRGCRHNCDFCSIQAFNKGREALRPVSDVICDIRQLNNNKPIFFVDDNLYHNKRQFRELLTAMIPLKKSWSCQISVDVTYDDELLDLMQKSGCMMVLMGIESLRSDNLKLMNKGWNPDPGKYTLALQKLKKRHIMVYGTFIFGYDHDTVEDYRHAVDFALKNRLFIANFNPLYPMPGTTLYKRMQDENRLLFDKWWTDPDFYYGKTMFVPATVSPEELEKECLNAKKRFNTLPSILYRSMDFRSNLYGVVRAAYFIMANLTNRREIYKKQGKTLGV